MTELPGCLIVTGLPGSGKSTVSRLVAERLPRAARLDGDDVHEMIVSGRVRPVGKPVDEAERQLRLREKNLCSLANNFDEAGFTVVVDNVIPTRKVLDFMVDLLVPRPVLLVVLSPSLQECQRRNATRDPDQRVEYDVGFLDERMRHELSEAGWWFDTSHLTPDETVEEILRQAPLRAAVDSGSVRRRRAEPGDRDFFFEVRRAAFRAYVEEISGWDEREQRGTAAQEFDELPVEIIEQSGQAIGYLCIVHADDHDFIEEIALTPDARGRGIGTQLVREVMQSAHGRRVPVRLSVLINNPAQTFYRRLGFHVVHVEHPRVKMEWRDAAD